MKTFIQVSIALFAVLSLGMATASAEDIPSGLSAHISAATNRVSTLRGLEFSVVLTNSGPTNVTIYPFSFAWKQKIAIRNPQGRFLVQAPKHISRSDMDGYPVELVLKPGASFTFTNKLTDEWVPSMDDNRGKYHARLEALPSNEVEITVE